MLPHSRLLLLLFVLASGPPGCHRKQPVILPEDAADKPAVDSPIEEIANERPVTNAESRDFAKAFVKGVHQKDQEALDEMFDWEELARRATSETKGPAEVRDAWFAKFTTARGVFLRRMLKNIESPSQFQLVRVRVRDGRKAVLFRYLPTSENFTYQEVLLGRDSNGSVRGIDLFLYSAGEYYSQLSGRLYRQAVLSATGKQGVLTSKADFLLVVQLQQAYRSGKYEEALKLYSKLPRKTQKAKFVQFYRVHSAASLKQETEFLAAVKEYEQLYPDDPALDLLRIGYHLSSKQYQAALKAVDRFDKSIGGDPYLDSVRAMILYQAKRPKQARSAAERAIAALPDQAACYEVLINITLEERKYKEAIKLLEKVREKFNTDLDEIIKLPVYDDLRKSAAYKDWVKARNKRDDP